MKKTVALSVRMDLDFKRRFFAACEKSGNSPSEVAQRLIAAYVDEPRPAILFSPSLIEDVNKELAQRAFPPA